MKREHDGSTVTATTPEHEYHRDHGHYPKTCVVCATSPTARVVHRTQVAWNPDLRRWVASCVCGFESRHALQDAANTRRSVHLHNVRTGR